MTNGITINQLPEMTLLQATTNDNLIVWDAETGTSKKLVLGNVATKLAALGDYDVGGNAGIVGTWPTSYVSNGGDIALTLGTMADITFVRGTMIATDATDYTTNVYHFRYKIDNSNPVLAVYEWHTSHSNIGDTPSVISAADESGNLVVRFETVNTGRTLNLSYSGVTVTSS